MEEEKERRCASQRVRKSYAYFVVDVSYRRRRESITCIREALKELRTCDCKEIENPGETVPPQIGWSVLTWLHYIISTSPSFYLMIASSLALRGEMELRIDQLTHTSLCLQKLREVLDTTRTRPTHTGLLGLEPNDYTLNLGFPPRGVRRPTSTGELQRRTKLRVGLEKRVASCVFNPDHTSNELPRLDVTTK